MRYWIDLNSSEWGQIEDPEGKPFRVVANQYGATSEEHKVDVARTITRLNETKVAILDKEVFMEVFDQLESFSVDLTHSPISPGWLGFHFGNLESGRLRENEGWGQAA